MALDIHTQKNILQRKLESAIAHQVELQANKEQSGAKYAQLVTRLRPRASDGQGARN